MAEDINEMKRELEEIRRIKEEMRRELQEAKRERLESQEREKIKLPKPPKPPKPAKAPRAPRRASIVDLRGLTDSLEDMMVGLEDSIRESVSGLEELGKEFSGPFLRTRTRKKSKKKHDRDIELIPPERIAKIVSPLGSEERLRILDFLKEGGRTFNDLETHTGKTGSSLTHHLTPLLEAGYVIKGEVRGTYYVTVEGRLAYRLAQWLTSKVERQQERSVNGNDEDPLRVVVDKEDDEFRVKLSDEVDDEVSDELHDHVQDEIDKYHDTMDEYQDQLDGIQDKMDEIQEQMDEEIEALEEEEDW